MLDVIINSTTDFKENKWVIYMSKIKDLTKKIEELFKTKADYILNLEQQNKEAEKCINILRKKIEDKEETIHHLNRIICLKNSEINRLTKENKKRYR